MLVGNAIIFSSLAFIAINGVWSTVVLIIVARRLDITRWNGTTADGEPATLTHLRSHAVLVILLTAIGTVLAHTISL
jgi:hypothetical protein